MVAGLRSPCGPGPIWGPKRKTAIPNMNEVLGGFSEAAGLVCRSTSASFGLARQSSWLPQGLARNLPFEG